MVSQDIILTEEEKWILDMCGDGLGLKELLINKKFNLSDDDVKKILNKLIDFQLITFEPYKDKDLKIYHGLRTEEEINQFKLENHPSYSVTEKGKRMLKVNY
ncbi:MAG: hypothetical protein KJ879_03215 [Nanoarchaeota archaeon]|nr:hypothetical protein [Nanoarchaeota archaeon]